MQTTLRWTGAHFLTVAKMATEGDSEAKELVESLIADNSVLFKEEYCFPYFDRKGKLRIKRQVRVLVQIVNWAIQDNALVAVVESAAGVPEARYNSFPSTGWIWAKHNPEKVGKDYPRYDEEDGRCSLCEGWGCAACEDTGGYP